MYILLILSLCATVWLGCPSDVPVTSPYTVDDVQFPKECPQIAKAGDHIMFEYVLSSGPKVHASQMNPEHFHHVVLADEDTTLHRTLKGMCENSTRILRLTGAGDKQLFLPPLMPVIEIDAEDGNTNFKVTVRHITSPDDYGIFQAMRMNNFSNVIDMIDDQLGGD